MDELFVAYWFCTSVILLDMVLEKPLSMCFPKFRVDTLLIPLLSAIVAYGSHVIYNQAEHLNFSMFLIILLSSLSTIVWVFLLVDDDIGSLMFLRKRVIISNGKAYLSSKLFNHSESAWFTNKNRRKRVSNSNANLVMLYSLKHKNRNYSEILADCESMPLFKNSRISEEIKERKLLQDLLNDHKGYSFNV